MKIGAIIQARTSSTRLPGKVLKELPLASGITVLEQVIKRLKRSKKLNNIIVATTVEKEDARISNVAKKERVKCFRGSNEDVLSRYYFAAKEDGLDVIVRITSDCPCIDPEVTDLIIERHLQAKADYTSNTIKRSYPHGLDAEVFNADILAKMHKAAKKDYEREHVTPYITRNPDIYKIKQVEAPSRLYAPDIRITLDTEEDYALLCAVFDYLYPGNKYFGAYAIIKLFKAKPWLKSINKKIMQKKIFETLKDELKEMGGLADLQDLKRAGDFIREYLSK